MRLFTAASLFDGQSLIDDGAVLVDDDGVVRDVGALGDVATRTRTPPERVSGLLLPGLVDAFTTLGDAFLRGKTVLGAGVERFHESARLVRSATDDGEIDDAKQAAIASLVACGVAALADATIDGSSHRALARVGVSCISVAPIALPPHDLDVARAAVRAARQHGGPAVLVCHASPAGSATDEPALFETIETLGALGDRTLLAHLGSMSASALARLAETGTHVVVCPRAALAVDVRLPPIGAMVSNGLVPALGTGNASGGHDVLAEAKAVAERYPSLSSSQILAMATSAGASALSLAHHGRFVIGARPGVLLIEGAPPPGVVDRARFSLTRPPSSRRWLVAPRADAQTTTAHEA